MHRASSLGNRRGTNLSVLTGKHSQEGLTLSAPAAPGFLQSAALSTPAFAPLQTSNLGQFAYHARSGSSSSISSAATGPPSGIPQSASFAGNSPEPPAEILPFLYLGGEQHAADLKSLDDLGITAILNVAVECERKREEPRFEYLQLHISDNFEEDIVKFFSKSFTFIDSVKDKGGKVLVHCSAGKSRSPTIVMAYLMNKNKWPLRQAYEYVKEKRKICPNLGFLCILAEFEKVTLGIRGESGLSELCRTSMSELLVLLVAEDDAITQTANSVLRKLGHHCDIAKTTSEAIDKLKKLTYDILLIDVSLPSYAGDETIQQIRDLEDQGIVKSRLVIIALSGEEEWDIPAGMDGLLGKPFNYAALEAALANQSVMKGGSVKIKY